MLDNINYLLTRIDWIDRVMSHLALRCLKGILVHGALLYKWNLKLGFIRVLHNLEKKKLDLRENLEILLSTTNQELESITRSLLGMVLILVQFSTSFLCILSSKENGNYVLDAYNHVLNWFVWLWMCSRNTLTQLVCDLY